MVVWNIPCKDGDAKPGNHAATRKREDEAASPERRTYDRGDKSIKTGSDLRGRAVGEDISVKRWSPR